MDAFKLYPYNETCVKQTFTKEDFTLTQTAWGKTPAGEEITCYTIGDPSKFAFTIMNYGANVTSILAPDKDGNISDIALGHSDISGYVVGNGYLGCCVVPSANRIGGAAFTLGGVEYKLDANDNGVNNLHSGSDPLCRRVWNVDEVTDTYITLSYDKKDGDMGFPGNAKICVTYTLEDTSLRIDYSCLSDADTIFNPTNHTYFNLAGHSSGTILDHIAWIDATHFTLTDDKLIPDGTLVPVAGTPMDFTTAHAIGDDIEADYEPITIAGGYDHNFVVADAQRDVTLVAYLEDPKSGRHMDVLSDLPGLQMYTSNFLLSSPCDKDGCSYGKYGAVCFETQFHPNAINIPSFAQPVAKAGVEMKTTTIYRFSNI